MTDGPTDAEPPQSISVEGDARSGVDMGRLREQLRRAVSEIGAPIHRAAIVLVHDERMTELHRRHMGVDATTDVLTFPSDERPGAIDVDIAVCVDEARRQAAERRIPLEHELLLYAVHGLLHCAGHDDVDEASAAAMHREEDRILRAVGIGPVFGAVPGGEGA